MSKTPLQKEMFELERSLLRSMKAGESLTYHTSKETKNLMRFDAVMAEYKDGYGHPVQKITGSYKYTYDDKGVTKTTVLNKFDYIYIRGKKI